MEINKQQYGKTNEKWNNSRREERKKWLYRQIGRYACECVCVNAEEKLVSN